MKQPYFEMLEDSKINFDYIYLLLVHVNESEKLIPRTNDENLDIEEEGKKLYSVSLVRRTTTYCANTRIVLIMSE